MRYFAPHFLSYQLNMKQITYENFQNPPLLSLFPWLTLNFNKISGKWIARESKTSITKLYHAEEILCVNTFTTYIFISTSDLISAKNIDLQDMYAPQYCSRSIYLVTAVFYPWRCCKLSHHLVISFNVVLQTICTIRSRYLLQGFVK